MNLDNATQLVNRGMFAFDVALGLGAIFVPAQTLQALGHDEPNADARELFRRCGPIWLTFAAAHAVAEKRGSERDWHALAWLRATELFTDVVWSYSPAVSRPGARTTLRLAGLGNLLLAGSFARLARKRRRS